MSVERVTARAEAVSMVSVGTPARSLSSVRSRISAGGVSSMNWTSGSIDLGIGHVLRGWHIVFSVGFGSELVQWLACQ